MGFNTVRVAFPDVPSTESNLSSNRGWTRRGLLTVGTAFFGALAGCSSHGGFPGGDDETPVETGTPAAETRPTELGATEGYPASDGPLTVQTTWTLSESVQRAAGLWNANSLPTSDRLVWSQIGARPAFDERLAGYFAMGAGMATAGGRADPPFRVATAIGDRGETGEALVDGSVDVAGFGPRRSEQEPTEYFDDRADAVDRHLIARNGWVFIVSPALAEAGVDTLTVEQIRRVFAGDITTWRALDGPDQEPFVFLGPDITGNWNPAYEDFLLAGDTVPAALDYRGGQAAELVSAAAKRDDALGVVQASGVRIARNHGVPTLDVIVDGKRRNVYDEKYPMTDDLYLYTLGEPGVRERAFFDLLSSPFGQRVVVGSDLLPVEPPAGW